MSPRLPSLFALSLIALMSGLPALAQTPDFGDDSSPWANDGECDDPRFTGPGAAGVNVDSDRMRDASDCRAAFEAGQVQLAGEQSSQPSAPAPGTKSAPAAPAIPGSVEFGDDSSQWARDGECDDPRFTGRGMATSLDPANQMRDATDCRTAFEAGMIQLAGGQVAPTPAPAPEPAQTAAPQPVAAPGAIAFGDDTNQWARDGECDDRRFTGSGMATTLDLMGVGTDATDCQALHQAGSVKLWNQAEAQAATQCSAIDFGTDIGEYANNAQCDDPRFEGIGAAGVLVETDALKDATDCRRLCEFGAVSLRNY